MTAMMPQQNVDKTSFPMNVRVSSHPAIDSKLSLLRDRRLPASQVRSLVTEISTIVSLEATSTMASSSASSKQRIALIVVLRAGLAMCDPFLKVLSPDTDVVVHHLGLYRETNTLEPVEYYNKLPRKSDVPDHVFVVDPLIATGGTAIATIDALRSWGAKKITYLSILATPRSMDVVAGMWPNETEFVVGHLDEGVDEKGYIFPGIGDIGDRLYGTSKSA